MPLRSITRAACIKLPRYKGSTTVSQLVCALRRVILHHDSIRDAAEVANDASRAVANHNLLSKSTLQRFLAALPTALRLPENATEGALMAWIDVFESTRRTELSEGHCLLTRVQEELVAQWIDARCRINMAVGRFEVIEHARSLLQPGEDRLMLNWYKGFRGRFPDLRGRSEQSTPPARLSAELNTDNVTNYFQLLAQFINLPPSQKWAGDETGLGADTRRVRNVIAVAGVKRVKTGKSRSPIHVGLMHIGNAEGTSLPMICVLKGKYMTAEHVAEMDGDALIGVQENGQFVQGHFIPILQHLITHGPRERPLLFIVDGAGSHVDMAAVDFAIAHEISILLLPSNLTHKLQVADVAVFGPFKTVWSSVCLRRRMERARNGVLRPPRIGDVIPAMVEAWKAAVTPANVIAGFRRTGIHPYDPEAWKVTSSREVARLGGLPLLITAARELAQQPRIAAMVEPHALALDGLNGSTQERKRCGECGQLPRKPPAPRLSTEAGVLLTSERTRSELQAIIDHRREKKEMKEKKRAEREANKLAKATAANLKGKGRKRKAREHEADSEKEAEGEKENTNPNTMTSARTERSSIPLRGENGLLFSPAVILLRPVKVRMILGSHRRMALLDALVRKNPLTDHLVHSRGDPCMPFISLRASSSDARGPFFHYVPRTPTAHPLFCPKPHPRRQ